MEIFFTVLVEFGLPVAASVVMGFFIFLVIKYILDSEQFDNIYDLINYLKTKQNIDNNTSIKLAFDSSIDIQSVINLLSKLNRLEIKSIEIFSEIY